MAKVRIVVLPSLAETLGVEMNSEEFFPTWKARAAGRLEISSTGWVPDTTALTSWFLTVILKN
jgi:hypothetical protein